MSTKGKPFIRKTGIGYLLLLNILLFSCGKAREALKTEQRYLNIADSRLYYEITGEAEPLIFLHGGFMDRRMWQHQVDTLPVSTR